VAYFYPVTEPIKFGLDKININRHAKYLILYCQDTSTHKHTRLITKPETKVDSVINSENNKVH